MEDFEVFRVDSEGKKTIIDLVAEEVPVTLFAGRQELATILASPHHLDELALGFLYGSGIIDDAEAAGTVRVDERRWAVHVELANGKVDTEGLFKRLFTPGCGKGTLYYRASDMVSRGPARGPLTIKAATLLALMHEFQTASPEFQDTGAVHSAALATASGLLAVREDIGRHNAVDKLIGHALLNRIALEDKIILSSGRLSSEIVLKVKKTTVPVLASRSAPTNQAIRHARAAGMTLIGFARGRRMNVYSGEQRILP
jgi:FdhD protein